MPRSRRRSRRSRRASYRGTSPDHHKTHGAAARLQRKVARLASSAGDDREAADRALSRDLDAQDLLTLALMPRASRLRAEVVHALARERARRGSGGPAAARAADEHDDDLVPVSLPIGKGATMVIMTKRPRE